MSKFGIYFNYKHDYRRALAYLVIPTFTTIMLISMANLTYEMYANKSLSFILYEDITTLRSFIWIPIVTSFTTFIRSLRVRFAALNSLLRFPQQYFLALCILFEILRFLHYFSTCFYVEVDF